MKTCIYREVSPDWHQLRTSAGLFFGRTKAEVFRKAGVQVSGGHRLARQVSERQQALEEFAREQQQAALRASEVQKGVRHVL